MNQHPKLNRTSPGRESTSRPTIGMLINNLVGLQQFHWLGAADAARAQQANLIIFAGRELGRPDNFYAQANVIYDLASAEHLDGLVIWTTTLQMFIGRQQMELFCRRYHPLPFVSVEQVLPGVPSLLVDNKDGMRAAISHLITVHGARRIAFIRGPETHTGAQERYQGYAEALAQHGLPLDPALVALPLGYWRPEEATARAHQLLDTHADLDAIAAANDDLALGVLLALQARHIRVPGDIAVVGFDNKMNIERSDLGLASTSGDPASADVERAVDSRATTLPLTTVRAPFYQLGFRAVELLLAQIRGEEVPEVVTLPTELIVRRSCGCFSPDGRQLTSEPGVIVPPLERKAKTSVPHALMAHQAQIRAQLQQVIELSTAALAPDWAERLVTAYIRDVQGETTNAFLEVLDELVRASVRSGDRLEGWWRVMFALRQQTLPYLATNQALARAEDLWQRVHRFMEEAAERFLAYQQLLIEKRDQIVRDIGQKLITTFDIGQLVAILAQELPTLGIPSCYLALYDSDPQDGDGMQAGMEVRATAYPTAWARAILVYEHKQRVELAPGAVLFPCRQLVPGARLRRRQPYTMLVESLFFREQQLGFVLFELGPRIGWIYEALQGQLNSALQGALLVQHTQEQNRLLQQEIRQRQQAEEELRKYRDNLQAANAELSQYAQIVSHDLRAPLRAIHNYAGFLHEDLAATLTSDQQMYLASLGRAVREAEELVTDLLELSQIGHHLAPSESIDLDVFLRSLVAALELPSDVEIDCAPDWPTIETDPTLLRQIFQNLILNAVTFNRSVPKRVELGWRPVEPAGYEFFVRDNGIGIEPRYQAQIFQMFQRLHTRQEYEGTGVGLAIVQKAVTTLQGTVRVESTPGVGSTFFVTLPRRGDDV